MESINVDDATYEACGYCDERSDRAGSRSTATSLRLHINNSEIYKKYFLFKDNVDLIALYVFIFSAVGHFIE